MVNADLAAVRAGYDGAWAARHFQLASTNGVCCTSLRHKAPEAGPFVCGPLGVYCTDREQVGDVREDEWVITHIPTGLRIGDAFWTYEDAFKAADDIAFLVDWWAVQPDNVKDIPEELRRIIKAIVYVQDDIPF